MVAKEDMKMKLERRKFLQIMGAAVVVCAAGGLTGCGKNVKKAGAGRLVYVGQRLHLVFDL